MRLRLLALPLILALGPVPASARMAGDGSQHLRQEPLRITAHGRTIVYRVEVARTPDQQEKGLMFRHVLPRRTGMIFPMDPPRVANFWMQNTLIPLDMVFIRPDGTIASIADNRIPFDRGITSSGEPVGAVLELAGGEAERDGLKPGDRVQGAGLNKPH